MISPLQLVRHIAVAMIFLAPPLAAQDLQIAASRNPADTFTAAQAATRRIALLATARISAAARSPVRSAGAHSV
jgi:hypothetical protein